MIILNMTFFNFGFKIEFIRHGNHQVNRNILEQ